MTVTVERIVSGGQTTGLSRCSRVWPTMRVIAVAEIAFTRMPWAARSIAQL